MWWRKYFQAYSQKVKIELISQLVVKALYNLFLLYAKLRAIEIY